MFKVFDHEPSEQGKQRYLYKMFMIIGQYHTAAVWYDLRVFEIKGQSSGHADTL